MRSRMRKQERLWGIQNKGGRVYCLEGISVEDAINKAHRMGFEIIQFEVKTYDWSLFRVTFTVESGQVAEARLG